ncbi:MAG: hypothetical protein IJN63_00080 [Clostridia bacterium]|nr:hypothetical protein [Clostridia bacterium]
MKKNWRKLRWLIAAISVLLIVGITVAVTLSYLVSKDDNINVMVFGDATIDQHELERVDKTETGTAAMQLFVQDKPLIPAVYGSTDALIPGQNAMPGSAYVEWYNNIVIGGKTLNPRNITRMRAVSNPWNGVWDSTLISNYQDKFVFVENTGNIDVYFRTIIALPVDTTGYVSPDGADYGLIHYNYNSSGIYTWDHDAGQVTIDGMLYQLIVATYEPRLVPGEISVPSFLQVAMDRWADHEQIKQFGKSYKIHVFSQAVQADGFANAAEGLNEAFGAIDSQHNPWTDTSANP